MSGQVTLELIAEATGLNKSTVWRRSEKDDWFHITKRVRGGKQAMFPIGTLPDDVRGKVLNFLTSQEEALVESIEEGEAIGRRLKLVEMMDQKAVEAAQERGLSRYNSLAEPGKHRADTRAVLLDMAKQFVKASGFAKRRGYELFCQGYNDGKIEVPEAVRAARRSVSPNSLDNWEKALKSEGLARLGGNYGRHRVGTGIIDSTPGMAELVKGMIAEHPHCSAKHVMRAIRARFEPASHPSYRTLQRWMETWREENKQLLAAVTSPDAWRSKYQAAGGSASEGITRLNQRWETDSTKGDVILADGARHVVVGIIDVFSRRMKLHVSRTSSSDAVAGCLRRAMLTWGVPEILTTDNGSDYVSKRITGSTQALGIERDLAPPFTPEHKPHIERAFGTFCRDMVELLPGFCGHDVAQRKDIESRRSFAQRMMGAKGAKAERIELRMSPQDFQDFCDWWTDEIYHKQPHGSLGKRTPAEVAAAWGPVPRPIKDPRALDVLLAPAPGGREIHTVGKKGIRVENAWFDAAALGGHEGRQVRCLVDETDIGEIYVFAIDGEFLCKAICPERTGVSRQQLAIGRKQHQKRVISEEKAALKAVAKRAGIDTIVAEIRDQQSPDDGTIVAFPGSVPEYTTPALHEAGIAARADQLPRAEQLLAEAPAPVPAQIIELTPRLDPAERERHAADARFDRWKAIGAEISANLEITAADRRWWEIYGRNAECTARVRAERMVAEGKVAG